MTDQEYILCTWKKRLWPAKVLCKSGVAGKTSNAKEKTSFEVEILGLEKQIRVSCSDALPLKEDHIESIASGLAQRDNSSEAVEELKYRRSLKIALDILNQNGSARQVPPSEGPNPWLSQENNAGSPPSTRCRLLVHAGEKQEPEASKKKKQQRNNPSLKTDTKTPNQKGSSVLEEGTNPPKCDAGDLCDTSNSAKPNCATPDSKWLPRLKKNEPRLSTKPKAGSKASPKPKEEKSKQGRKSWRGAGSPVAGGGDFPEDRAQPLAGEGSPLSIPCVSDTAVPARTSTRVWTVLDSSCKSASDGLEKSIGCESDSPAKQLDGRKRPVDLKQLNGEQEISATAASCRKRKSRNCPGSSWLEPSDLASKIISSESLSGLSALVDEEEEDEELPSILSHQEPQPIEEGILVWCKLRRYPYWPAVVKNVRRKHRKACVLFIEGNTNDKKKGFSVPLRNLKHFDCEEKQDLINRAKEGYRQEIEWCIRLISDYRIRVGCHSFTGSFLEYFAADISYPVRKEGYHGLAQMTFPNTAEEDVEESSPETSPQKPCKKLLPDRTRAARDKANKKIVEFIVKTKGAEEHLLAILKSRKQSRWLKEFRNSSQYVTCVETYLEDEEQLDLVVNYLKEVYCGIDTKNLHRINGDGIKFISDVLLPEAIIYAISALDDIDYKKAEEKYIKGPSVSKREREIFDEEILERKRWKSKAASADS
ncbi:MUM1 protein, partial [Caloenas nicobarica]|nr:MUM1 protein [Caloenas nicobarica]